MKLNGYFWSAFVTATFWGAVPLATGNYEWYWWPVGLAMSAAAGALIALFVMWLQPYLNRPLRLPRWGRRSASPTQK